MIRTTTPNIEGKRITQYLGIVNGEAIVWLGRRLLDQESTTQRVAWVTTIMHAVLMVLFGTAIIKAIQTSDTWSDARTSSSTA